MNEGEKERKEGGDKEIRKNVYGGRRKKKKKTNERELEKKEREWKHFFNKGEKERKEGGDKEIRTNMYGGKKIKNVWIKWNERKEK